MTYFSSSENGKLTVDIYFNLIKALDFVEMHLILVACLDLLCFGFIQYISVFLKVAVDPV